MGGGKTYSVEKYVDTPFLLAKLDAIIGYLASINSEKPKTSKSPVAEEIPEPMKSKFEESQICFDAGAYLGCLLVCKTTLIALQRNMGITRLEELQGKGISNTLYKQADEVRLWANMFGHEDVPEKVDKDDCEQLMTYIETLLNAIYVEPKRFSDLNNKRQQLKSGGTRE